MLRWPAAAEVLAALARWAVEERRRRPELVRLGYFGSHARGEAGVGSDLDLVAVVSSSALPFERRTTDWDLAGLPVPADLLVYTEGEWDLIRAGTGRFARVLRHEVVWI